jgi:hypothetical protein
MDAEGMPNTISEHMVTEHRCDISWYLCDLARFVAMQQKHLLHLFHLCKTQCENNYELLIDILS